MLKAGIITFASAHNYGAILQVSAMQKYLKNLGIEAHVINYRPKEIDNVYKIYRTKGSKFLPLKVARKIAKVAQVNIKYRWKIKKFKNFENFISNTLNTTEPYMKLKDIQNAYLDYDILIAGSDQIWNTDLTKGFQPAYFLEFGRKDAIRISYAASLGRNDIDETYVLFYKRYLKNFDYISVREKSMIPIFQELTDKEVTQVLDPTLLLKQNDYEELKKDSKYKNEKYIYTHFIGKDENVIEIADKVSTQLKLPVLHNFPNKVFENELGYHYNESPEQIIDVVKNAEMIISDSFHLTVLAIIYHKKFITIPHSKRPERMKNLLGMLGLEKHLIENVRFVPSLDKLDIDYEKVEEKLEEERKKSVEFLQNALFNKKPENKTNYFDSKDKFECCGCGVCAEICPAHAITMDEDEEGFVYPSIDEEKCTKCNLCKKTCIYKNNSKLSEELKETEVYAIMHKNKEIVKNSASGGMFTALYQKIIQENGYVIGVRYNEDMKAIYDIAHTEKECEKFRGSKYVAADIGNIRKVVKEKLENGAKVLFTGNPCQVAALKKYLNKEYDNLYLVELICHSTPSPKFFRKYIRYIEDKYNNKVVNVEFRNKKLGWDKSTVKVQFKDGKELYEIAKYNNYNRAFANFAISRPSCYNCQFTGDTRNSDMVIGDYWGINDVMPKINKNEGISLLKINTKKGKDLFEEIKENVEYYKSNYKEAYKANHKFPIIISLKRNDLMKQVDDMDIDKLLRKYNQFKNKNTKECKEIREQSL